jgi:SAM-dependent methyltransferase
MRCALCLGTYPLANSKTASVPAALFGGPTRLKIEHFESPGRGMQKKRNSRRSVMVLVATVVLLCSAVARAAESEIDRLVQVLELKRGSVVADVGAGSGELSIAIAKRVGPQGKVYSTEINPKLLDNIRNLVRKEKAQNVIPVAGKEHDTELPPGCCDAIIDFEPNQLPGQPAPPGVPANRGGHGVPKKIVAAELTKTGFVLVKTIDWPISPAMRHYCMLFIKPPLRQ